MDREGHPHNGSAIAWERRPRFFIDTKKFTGKSMMAYGQTAITEDLYVARDAAGGEIIDEARNLALHDLTSTRPYVTYEKNGQTRRIDCDYIAGCDGYHGVSRQSMPASVLRTYEKGYPFGWLGIMSETPPASCAPCGTRASETIASAIGCARGGGRGSVAASSSATTEKSRGAGTTGPAGSTCRVGGVTRVAIRWRCRGCGSAWPTVGAHRSVNAGCTRYAECIDCDCVCWRRISSEKQT
jgi:hypothetical protein